MVKVAAPPGCTVGVGVGEVTLKFDTGAAFTTWLSAAAELAVKTLPLVGA